MARESSVELTAPETPVLGTLEPERDPFGLLAWDDAHNFGLEEGRDA